LDSEVYSPSGDGDENGVLQDTLNSGAASADLADLLDDQMVALLAERARIQAAEGGRRPGEIVERCEVSESSLKRLFRAAEDQSRPVNRCARGFERCLLIRESFCTYRPDLDTTAPPRVLVIGLDPYRVPGPWDPAPVAEAIEAGLAKFAEHGVGVETCLVGLDGSDDVETVVGNAL
jgi:hypothetical protein